MNGSFKNPSNPQGTMHAAHCTKKAARYALPDSFGMISYVMSSRSARFTPQQLLPTD
jgi:hypothetical protein